MPLPPLHSPNPSPNASNEIRSAATVALVGRGGTMRRLEEGERPWVPTVVAVVGGEVVREVVMVEINAKVCRV